MRTLRQWFCRHDFLVRFEPDRIYEQCQTCRFERPGWMLDAPRPVVKYTKLMRFRRRIQKVA